MIPKLFILKDAQVRKHCANYIMTQALDGYHIKIVEPVKKREQEEKYHCMIGEIAKVAEHLGRKWDADDMKRLLVDEFSEEMRSAGTPLHNDGSVTPSLDGRRIVQLGIQTRDFYVKEAAQFIEFLYAFGSERGVIFNEG